MAKVSTYLNFLRNSEEVFKFWGDYYGSCTDKYGVQWMFNCNEK
jgi:predicted 3-demethylubiquinone-9 3-methyltransferase (glyoxalase superfamily)